MSNLFKRFQRLIPNPPLRVGTVIQYSNGVAKLQEEGGGLTTARGEAALGDRVFFRDNVIEGPAPDLPLEVIEI